MRPLPERTRMASFAAQPELNPEERARVPLDVVRALEEDVGSGDVTAALIDPDARSRATLVCRERAVLAGRDWFETCFRALDPELRIAWRAVDGQWLEPGGEVCTLEGASRALLTAERSAINFLQTLSATATRTAAFVEAVAGTRARILDTRKTLPGLRLAQKYAVRCGGGHNHRIGLYDAVMVKENHIAAAGGIAAIVMLARSRFPGLAVIVEVESFEELAQAIEARADRILIDDFSLHDMRRAVEFTARRVPLEVSGGVGLEGIRAIAGTGVDCISIGSLTKHVQAVDFSLRLSAP
jgi:nicotinate-nucleotide pyrophosphorylase (carboxylating)